jgi:GT2 family glycosyltransferase
MADNVLPRVAAVLVVHNGGEWISSALATLAKQRYPALDLVVVDNGSTDGTAELLARRIPQGRLVTLPANVGFGRGVAAAISDVPAVSQADLLLLLHDDLALAPDALPRLVRALQEDETLGIVGPKLREWTDDPVLAEVGMTVDRFGRAENRLDPGELDQGQHDRQRDVLYVSTAGMLLRSDVLRAMGGFDARYHVLRDDLDLCWRAWLAGYRVEVVPEAVAYHLAAASRFARPVGRGRSWEARYLAERNTLATLLKNYSALRLLWTMPIVLLLALAKILGFAATRRFGDAMAVLSAYGWNVLQLPRTLRRRRQIQRRRQVSDSDLVRLFAPGLPRARIYAEAVGDWLAGGSTRVLVDESEAEDPMTEEVGGWRAFQRTLRAHPALAVACLLVPLYLIGLAPLLGSGQLVGGDVAPWPVSARDFLRAYASPWNGEPAASAGFASPVQALLGFASFAGFGSVWLAQRLIVLGLLPLAWVSALRAGRLITRQPAPRALGATMYALSPVLVGAMAQGRFGVLVVAALLPGLLLLAVRAGDAAAPPNSAWRATALLSLGLVVAGAAAPALLPGIGVLWLAALARAAVQPPGGRQGAARIGAAGLAAATVLAPWLVSVGLAGWAAVSSPAPLEQLPLWRALGVVPETLPAFAGGTGAVLAVMTLAVAVAALMLGLRARPGIVAGLVATVVVSGLAAWGAARLRIDFAWLPAMLLPAVLAQAGLGVVAARWLVMGLREYAFGLRQLTTVLSALVLLVALTGSVLRLLDGPWVGLERDPELIPAFVTADGDRVGPYRIVVIREQGGVVGWEVVGATGPRMTRFGTIQDRNVLATIDGAVAGAAGGGDPRAVDVLGLVNVRYVVVAGDSDPVAAALARQPTLEPLPAGGADVYRVATWLPRAVVLPPAQADALVQTGGPGPTAALAEQGLRRVRAGLYEGSSPQAEEGLLILAEGTDPRWRAFSGPRQLERVPVAGVNAFAVPPEAPRLRVVLAGGVLHRIVITAQALLVLGIVSLALRPPGQQPRAGGRLDRRPLPAVLEDEEAEAPDPASPQEVVTAAVGAAGESATAAPGLGEATGEAEEDT